MAEIPDVNPTKPIWPTRPDERSPGRQEPGKDPDRKRQKRDTPGKERDHGDGDHLIDEYV